MYKNSARFKKRNTYAFKAKETTVNAINIHSNTWNKNGRENRVNLLYLKRISSCQIYLKQVSLPTDPLLCYFVLRSSRSRAKVLTAGDLKLPERKGMTLGKHIARALEKKSLHFHCNLSEP